MYLYIGVPCKVLSIGNRMNAAAFRDLCWGKSDVLKVLQLEDFQNITSDRKSRNFHLLYTQQNHSNVDNT